MANYVIDNQPTPIDYELQSEALRAVQNAKNLLMTRMGEVPYDRMRGFDWAMFDLPYEDFAGLLLPELDRVMLWEPNVEIKDARHYHDARGELIIEAEIEVDIDG